MDLQLLGGIIGLVIHIPLLISIWQGKTRQSFASYALWSALDFIAAYSIYMQQGNFWLPFLYAIGAGLASTSLLIKKNFSWGVLEWFVVMLVIVSVFAQYSLGEFWAMIASITSLAIASIPQIINTFKKPKDTPTGIYIVFCFANLISLLGAKSFALEEILYAGSALVICLIITIFSVKKV